MIRWHQDIKPANILVMTGNETSPYRWRFKLADLGNCHFQYGKLPSRQASAIDSHGTRCYGESFERASSATQGKR